MTMPEQRSKRCSRRVRAVIALGVIVVLGIALIFGVHWAFRPWAMSLPGRPGLVGYWQGEATFGPGDSRHVVLHLTDRAAPALSNVCTSCPAIHGTAEVCGAGRDTHYEVDGDPKNYTGTRFQLEMKPVDKGPGAYLDDLDGEWDGDELGISTHVFHAFADGSVDPVESQPAVDVELHHVGQAEYDAAC